MEFKGRKERAECYEARDAFFVCNEKYPKDTDTKVTCKELYDKFEKTCGLKWTEHFTRKNDYLKFKDKLMKEGIETLDEEKLKKPTKG